MLESPRQFACAHPAEIDRLPVRLPVAGSEPINPAAFFPRLEIEQRPALFRNVLRVIDDLPVHVDDVERAIGTVGGEDRPEPGVTRGRKSRPLRAGLEVNVTPFGDRTCLWTRFCADSQMKMLSRCRPAARRLDGCAHRSPQ